MVAITEPYGEPHGNVPDEVMPETSSLYEGTETDNQSTSSHDYQLISTFLDIRAFCHVNLLDANIRIVHEDNTGCVVLELRSGSCTVLFVRCHFNYLKNRVTIMPVSYGIAEKQLNLNTRLNDHCHVHLHVFHTHYSLQLNGHEILRLAHRLPFQNVIPSELSRLIRRNRRMAERQRNRVLPY